MKDPSFTIHSGIRYDEGLKRGHWIEDIHFFGVKIFSNKRKEFVMKLIKNLAVFLVLTSFFLATQAYGGEKGILFHADHSYGRVARNVGNERGNFWPGCRSHAL